MDKDISAFLGLGSTFMASTMARMGLKVLLDISEALTAQWGLRPFPLGKEGLFPLRLTWTSRTEDRAVLLFTWIRQESISGRESLQGTQNKADANPKAVPVPAIDYQNPPGDRSRQQRDEGGGRVASKLLPGVMLAGFLLCPVQVPV